MANAIVEMKLNLPATISAEYSEEMENMKVSFDRIKVPSGGGLAFEVPGDDPDSPDVAKEIVGIIVDQYGVNAYWQDKYEGQGNPPDCSSLDGNNGTGNPGGTCATCPLNQWGSDGKGKACKNMRRLFISTIDGNGNLSLIPYQVTLPPTSIQNWADFLAKRILQKGLQKHEVIVKLTLKKDTNAGGIEYSKVNFAIVGMVPSDKLVGIAKYCADIKKQTRMVSVSDNEYVQTESKDLDDMDLEGQA